MSSSSSPSNNNTLFTLPIGTSGQIVVTEPSSKLYLLTFTSPPDNRLTPSFCAAFTLALNILELKHPKGVVVTTSGIGKFYSNGLDLELAINTPGFWGESLYVLWRRILTYPMPMIALINGHAFAGGLMTAMMHDYRIMNPSKGYLCLNEVEFGAPLRPPMASIFRNKLPRPDSFRTILLEAKRFTSKEALEIGMIDGLGGWDETLQFIQDKKIAGKGDSGVYGKLKEEMFRETVRLLEQGGTVEDEEGLSRAKIASELDDAAVAQVQEWERGSARDSKL